MARIAAALIAMALFGAGNLAAASDADETTMEAVDTTDGTPDTTTDPDAVSGASRGRGLLAPMLAVLVVLMSTGGAVAESTTMAEAESTAQDTTDVDTDGNGDSTTDASVSAACRSRGLLAPLLATLALLASVGGAAASDATTTEADTADTTGNDEVGGSTTDASVSGTAKPWVSMSPALLAAAAVGLAARR